MDNGNMLDSAKMLGQIFTPVWMVKIILDQAGYNGEKILSKTILEPSAGEGIFLVEIVERFIKEAKKVGWTNRKIKNHIEKNIFGIEIDKKVFKKCISNLNLISEKHNLQSIKWSLMNADALKHKKTKNRYDFVVGNPPYIRIHNLDKDTSNYLKKNYDFCKNGMIDIYLAFFELGLCTLKKDGVLVYITPNMFLRNYSNKDFRNYLVNNNLLRTLIDFGSYPVFNDANTYNCVTKLQNGNTSNSFDYYENEGKKIKKVNLIKMDKYKDKRFIFTTKQNEIFISKMLKGKPLSELANIQYGFATMRDKIYISKDVSKPAKNGLVTFNNEKVEKELLKDIVKGSRIFYKNKLRIEKIIFPYKKINNRWVVIPELEMQTKYMHTYKYLSKHKSELEKRDVDKGILWYEYGRSQGVQSIHEPKIVVDILVNGEIKLNLLKKDVMVYSGIFITTKAPLIKKVQKALATKDFYNYARILGKDMQGGYKSISTKIIKSYSI